MLTLLTPFILGGVIQVSAILAGVSAAPSDDNRQATQIRRDEFSYRLDKAVFPPCFLTLLSAALLNRGRLSEEVVTIIAVSAVVMFALGQYLLRGSTVSQYMVWSNRFRGITPLNALVLVANVVLAAVTLATASPVEEDSTDGEGAVTARTSYVALDVVPEETGSVGLR